MKKKIAGILICTILIFTTVLPVTGERHIIKAEDATENFNVIIDEYPLPPPISVDMVLEETICRRMSVRSFTGEAVTDEELSTILWAAYGYTENGNRSIFNPDGTYSTIIYVIRSDATYKYVPEDHSLSLFKSGNYLHLGQYTSPIKFGLVWDMDVESDENRGMADIGMIGQNIYFDANALDLGTVTTGMYVEDLYELDIPSNEKPEIIMPLGHPSSPYDFTYNPLPASNLPEVINNTLSLEDAINDRLIIDIWDDIPLSLLEQSQLIWSSYGYSYLWDNVNNKRHRTVPSAIAYYPFKIFAANHSGVYQYHYSTHSITEILQGDQREEIKNCVEYNDILLDTAPFIIIPCLDTNIGVPQYQRFWSYENGAIIHNILLEATVLTLSANVIYDISNEAGLRSALGIASQTNLKPLSVVPVGNPFTSPPEKPDIDGPTIGAVGMEYEYSFSTTDPDENDVYYYIEWGDGQVDEWVGPYKSGELAKVNHTWASPDDYEIRAKAKDTNDAESEWSDVYPVTIVENEPPNVPTIEGKTSGEAGTSYLYTFTSTDPNEDQVSYYIEWGDGDLTGWTAFQASGPPGYSESHAWDEQGTYTIEAKAVDVFGAESPWGELKVTMPRNRAINGFFLRFLEQFPILQKILLLQR
jgi:nitroreductase